MEKARLKFGPKGLCTKVNGKTIYSMVMVNLKKFNKARPSTNTKDNGEMAKKMVKDMR